MKRKNDNKCAAVLLLAAFLLCTGSLRLEAAELDPGVTEAQPAAEPQEATAPMPESAPQPAEQQPQEPTAPVQESAPQPTEQQQEISAQTKKDIENSLDANVKEALINGYLSLLNREYILKEELEMELTGIGDGHELDPLAAKEITRMVKDAKKDGVHINVTSAYRTYAKQAALFANKIERLEEEGYGHAAAVEKAGTVVAVPGTSEHQLGLTVDFVTNSYKKLDEGIRNTKEYQWIAKNGWKYGYVIRYPKEKSDLTGIISEPWHLRYVGIPAAKLISDQDICLEEFLGVAYDGQKNGISYGAGWINTGR